MDTMRHATLQQSMNIQYGYPPYSPPVMPPMQGGCMPMPPAPIPPSGGGSATPVKQYPTKDDFPVVGDSGIMYIDQSTNTVYYWKDDEYTPLTSGNCNCDCVSDDDCCIWGDVLNGGGANPSEEDCPYPHGGCCHGGSGSGSGVELNKDNIIKGLGYTPASVSDLAKEKANREAMDKALSDKIEKCNCGSASSDAAKALKMATQAKQDAETAKAIAKKVADAVDAKIGKLEKQIADNKKEIGKVAKDVEAVQARVDDFENSLKDVNGEIDKVQQAIEDIQDAIEEQVGATTWELLQVVELTRDEQQIEFKDLNCRKIYASCTICGSDENDTHQRLEIRLNENNTKHRIATLERAVPASSRDTRYTNLYAHALNTNRVGGYIQKDSDYPDTNFILQALSTRSAKNEEISFGTEINNLYFTTGNPEGKLGRGTKIVLYGIKSQE